MSKIVDLKRDLLPEEVCLVECGKTKNLLSKGTRLAVIESGDNIPAKEGYIIANMGELFMWIPEDAIE